MLVPDEKKRCVPDIRGAIHRVAEEVVESAVCRLNRHFLFQGHINSLHLSYHSGTLRVTGQLPSYYLKQVLQTSLRDLPGVDRVENRVEVPATNGKAASTNHD